MRYGFRVYRAFSQIRKKCYEILAAWDSAIALSGELIPLMNRQLALIDEERARIDQIHAHPDRPLKLADLHLAMKKVEKHFFATTDKIYNELLKSKKTREEIDSIIDALEMNRPSDIDLGKEHIKTYKELRALNKEIRALMMKAFNEINAIKGDFTKYRGKMEKLRKRLENQLKRFKEEQKRMRKRNQNWPNEIDIKGRGGDGREAPKKTPKDKETPQDKKTPKGPTDFRGISAVLTDGTLKNRD
ncbi:MAG: hypothetical protein IH986_16010 [Planctomycetes bacterium]|nr:hypothetical protein [Planctomycetota bacterium]